MFCPTQKRFLLLLIKKQIDFGTHKLGQAYTVPHGDFTGKTDFENSSPKSEADSQ